MTQRTSMIKEPKWFLIDRHIRDRPGGHHSLRSAFWSKKDRKKARRQQKKIIDLAIHEFYEEISFYDALEWFTDLEVDQYRENYWNDYDFMFESEE